MRLACKENDNVHKKCAKHAFDTLPEENTQRSGKILENTKINLKNRWVKKSWLKRGFFGKHMALPRNDWLATRCLLWF